MEPATAPTIAPYYDAEGITIYQGDCLEILPTIGPVDHVITDPPYDAHTHANIRRGAGPRTRPGFPFRPIDVPNPLDFSPLDDDGRTAAGRAITRAARGWILVFCEIEGAMLWRDALEPARYLRTQLWRKVDAAPQFTGDRPGLGWETIVTCWNRPGRTTWNGGGRHGVYDYPTVKVGRAHPSQKPEALMIELVRLFSDPGDTIADPYMGSGSLLVAAKRLGRRAIGIERQAHYCDMAVRRLAQSALTLEADLEPRGGRSFWEESER